MNAPILRLLLTAIVVTTGCTSQAPQQAQKGPSPVILRMYPGRAVVGVPFQVQGNGRSALAVTGNNFQRGAAININGQKLPTVFANEGLLTAEMPPEYLTKPGTIQFTVVNPDGVVSNVVDFVIKAP